MLDHLRKQAVETLAQATQITLATHGPAGLRTSMLPCESMGLNLYVRLPRTSDHLVNLEDRSECVAATADWELRGRARTVPLSDFPGLALVRTGAAEWDVLVEVHPIQIQIVRPVEGGYAVTIDIDEPPAEGAKS